MVLDTGSDIVWLQCAPCKKCYSQSDPVFDPRKSSSYAGIPCDAPICRRLDSPGCNSRKRTCLYQVSYGDGSFTTGDFSTETLTFRRTRVARVAVGCGHDNQGLFVGAAGLLGLGRDTCFDLSGKTEVKVPTVVLHFRGADVSLPASNYLIPVDTSGAFCFAFAGTMSGLSIIGNIQQQGFRVVYDLGGSRIGFAPRGCA
ncbi:unnamed protein product [Linum tenue]|uniref:Peptidase A1 domain-containing protein n=1 Tax=Linum tenue TaxID=586396 RepID=A0AAV0RDX1_9ROSI|nr:unnamed protein product [Linum tenue]